MTAVRHIPNFADTKLLVYGDLMLDRYWYGDTSRISPEAPVPVVHVEQCQNRPGGAANVALNITALGGHAQLFGVVGDDAEGRELADALQQKQVDCRFYQAPGFPTITKLRVLGRNQQLIRMDFEKPFIDIDDHALLVQFSQQLADANVVVLSDYAKGALRHAPQLIAAARAQGVPVLVDPKGADFSPYRGATLLTPNLKEFEAIVGPTLDADDIEAKARQLITQYELDALLVTRGKDGMTLVQRQADTVHVTAHARDVFDVTGAGDTVIAVAATALATGEPLEHAIALANLAAGIVVTKLGAETVSVAELRRAAQRRGHIEDGVVSEEALITLVADAHAHGEKVVMTNGCFDILHHGHIQYLYEARALGKRLVIAVNDDASVARLKGPSRPLNPVADRMAVLSALRVVDWVVPFSEDTPARLIEAVGPDVLVKGGDWQPHQIAGSDFVLAKGGEVRSLSFKDGYSTTSIIEKVQQEEVI